jgi:hypothetical protein
MKRKNIILAMLPIILAIIVMQSCSKIENPAISIYSAFSEPKLVAPLDGAELHITGTTVDLSWTSTNAGGDAILGDVYFGKEVNPPLYKANNTSLKLTVPVEVGQTYYWKATMKDSHGMKTYGPVWSFTIFDPLSIYLGDFLCDEPEEAYSYDVSFVKTGSNIIQTANYWNSGWVGVFTLDLTANTYSMPKTTWGNYAAQESGKIYPATSTLIGNYSIWYKGNVIEAGVHTYTKY